MVGADFGSGVGGRGTSGLGGGGQRGKNLHNL